MLLAAHFILMPFNKEWLLRIFFFSGHVRKLLCLIYTLKMHAGIFECSGLFLEH